MSRPNGKVAVITGGARAIFLHLASDQAKWVTGSELVIDDGYTAR